MLIPCVLSSGHPWPLLPRRKRSSQPVGPHPFTRHGWFRLPPIDQYSSLLPPVGVWAVSQPLSPPRHRRHGGPLPRRQANASRAHPQPPQLYTPRDAPRCSHAGLAAVSAGFPPVAGRLLTRYAPFRRSPPEVLLLPRCPSTCMC